MSAETIQFSSNDLLLTGTLYLPLHRQPYATVTVCHAANAALRSDPFYQHLKDHLPEEGIALFLYDRRGSGESQGDFNTADFTQLAQDAASAAAYLRTREDIGHGRIGLYGISQGGWIAPVACARSADISFQVIVSGCGVSPAQQMDYAASYHLKKQGYQDEVIKRALSLRSKVNEYYRGREDRTSLQVALGQAEREPWFEYAFLPTAENVPEDVRQSKWYYQMDYDPLPIWQEVRQPTLFLFGEDDPWVPVEASRTNFQAVTKHIPDVSIQQIDGTGHLMEIPGQEDASSVSPHYLQALLEWLRDRSS